MTSKLYWIDLSRFDQKLNKSPFLEICNCLSAHGFNTHLLTGFRREKYFPEGFDVKIKYFASVHAPGLFRYVLMLNIFLWLLPRIGKSDIVVVQPGALVLACLLKWFAKCKVHLDVRTVPVEIHSLRDRLDRWFFWHLPMKWLARHADGYSFITEPLREAVEKEFHVHFEKYVIWTSGVNSQRFAPNPEPKKKESDSYVLLYSGVITKNRGLDSLLYAISMLEEEYKKRLKLCIVGDGSYREELERLAADLGVDSLVEFCGYVPYEKMPETLRKADFFICPLPDRQEWSVSSPIKVFEYMMCAKPIILTPIEAHRQIARKQDFIVWTKGDRPHLLAEGIRSALEQYSTLRQAARKAPDFVRANYDWTVQGKKLADYLAHHIVSVR